MDLLFSVILRTRVSGGYSLGSSAAQRTLTPGRGQNHVGKLGCGGDLGDPSTMTLEGPPYCHLLGHFGAGKNHL